MTHKKIHEINSLDRPREKIVAKGPESLSNYELLLAMIGSGNKQSDVTEIAREVQKVIASNGSNLAYKDLEKIKGLGNAKIAEILAAFELSKRFFIQSDKPIINSSEDVLEQLRYIRDKKQEYFVCLTLDGANRLIEMRTITIGTLNANLIHPREVFADAISDRAAGVIIAHNHPSGTLRPSENDIDITKKLVKIGEMLGIKILDHIIVAKNNFFSFESNDLLN